MTEKDGREGLLVGMARALRTGMVLRAGRKAIFRRFTEDAVRHFDESQDITVTSIESAHIKKALSCIAEAQDMAQQRLDEIEEEGRGSK